MILFSDASFKEDTSVEDGTVTEGAMMMMVTNFKKWCAIGDNYTR